MTITVRGADAEEALMRILIPILSELEKATMAGARKGGRAMLKRARELSPTDTGESDRSGFVAVDDLTIQVGFTSLVSLLNHENLDWQHTDGGQPKFLEAAAAETLIEEYVAEEVRRALG